MFLTNFIKGLIIGVGFIIPGISGAIIATMLGEYYNIVLAINNIFKKPIQSLMFLLPFGLGIITSIISFSNILLYLLKYYYCFTIYVFIGLILGGVPYLLKDMNGNKKGNVSYITIFITTLIGIVLLCLEKIIKHNNSISKLKLILGGLFYGFGKIMPGVSSSVFLMILGIYEYMLKFSANPILIIKNLKTLFPFIISAIFSFFSFCKIIEILFNKYNRYMLSIIIGFVISSVLFIYPGKISISYGITLIVSFNVSYFLTKK